MRSDRSAAMPDLSAEKERNSQSCDENAETRHPVDEEHVFYSHDSIQSWARRVGDQLGKRAGKSKEELRDFLVQMAKVTRPRVGEGNHRFNARAQERLGSIDRTLDPTSPETALRHGEDLNSWLMRYVPLCLVVEDGKSLDDLIPKLAEAAQFRPPRIGESAASWIGNVYQFGNCAWSPSTATNAVRDGTLGALLAAALMERLCVIRHSVRNTRKLARKAPLARADRGDGYPIVRE